MKAGLTKMNKGLMGINMTNFFNREMFMYSLGDIKFKKPVSLKRVAYSLAFLLVWSLPMFFIWGLIINPVYLLVMFGPPLGLAHIATKPVFGGKNLLDFLLTMFKFVQEPKGWADLNESREFGEDVYYVESEIWISRRRELQILADIKEKQFEEEAK